MPHSSTAPKPPDRELLAVRSRLIDLAAILDRLDRLRAGGRTVGPQDGAAAEPGHAAADDFRERVRRSLAVLANDTPDRAAQVQIIFSLPYDDQWAKRSPQSDPPSRVPEA